MAIIMGDGLVLPGGIRSSEDVLGWLIFLVGGEGGGVGGFELCIVVFTHVGVE